MSGSRIWSVELTEHPSVCSRRMYCEPQCQGARAGSSLSLSHSAASASLRLQVGIALSRALSCGVDAVRRARVPDGSVNMRQFPISALFQQPAAHSRSASGSRSLMNSVRHVRRDGRAAQVSPCTRAPNSRQESRAAMTAVLAFNAREMR